MNSTLIIAFGGLIILVGTAITIWGSYRQGLESSEQTDRIEGKIDRVDKGVSEVEVMKEHNEQEFKKLKHPLPTEVKTNHLTFLINANTKELKIYVDKIIEEGLKKHKDKISEMRSTYDRIGFDPYVGEFEIPLKELFNGKTIFLNMALGDVAQPGLFNSHTSLLNWEWQIPIDLDELGQLSFMYNLKNADEHVFELKLRVNELYKAKTSRNKNISSSIEMCNQTVWTSCQVVNMKLDFFNPKNVKIETIQIEDNYLNTYGVSFTEVVYVTKNYPGFSRGKIKVKPSTVGEYVFNGKLTCKNL